MKKNLHRKGNMSVKGRFGEEMKNKKNSRDDFKDGICF
jgi:hypothetical protein